MESMESRKPILPTGTLEALALLPLLLRTTLPEEVEDLIRWDPTLAHSHSSEHLACKRKLLQHRQRLSAVGMEGICNR